MQSHENPLINPDPLRDSAGVPWQGRSFEVNPFADDDGSADPNLLSALKRFHSKAASSSAVVDALRDARLLVPLLAAIGDFEIGAHGHAVDKSAELSVVTVEGPDGQRVLPVFSSAATMSAWNPKARPVPTDSVRVMLAAASEGTNRVVLDPGSEFEFAIRRPAIAAVAQGLPWQHPAESERIASAFRDAVDQIAEINDFTLQNGDEFSKLAGPEVILVLQLVPGLGRSELDGVLKRLAENLAKSEEIANLLDSMTIKLRS
ncbi:SseB family protein [Candidatus Rhodoluna planktonica]|uniref:SseB protein N-terminal domain-containing protein n=1 Tax=Candidatus Rhodoluna planktonica TaxID=535712 RepID=A0A1D9DZJ0_9MICO|nr:SseB family protein [Candidatus Rhodoluna planktonica]AOY56216.1 hypothetical protein A4Z71_04440 [Candidatus Rhodoluna planktonica]